MKIETFEEAWARFEDAGYVYGEAALDHVRFGWNIAHGMRPHFDGDNLEPKLHVAWSFSELDAVQQMLNRALNTLEPKFWPAWAKQLEAAIAAFREKHSA